MSSNIRICYKKNFYPTLHSNYKCHYYSVTYNTTKIYFTNCYKNMCSNTIYRVASLSGILEAF